MPIQEQHKGRDRFPQVAEIAHAIAIAVGSLAFRVSINARADRVMVSHDGETLTFAPAAAWRLVDGDASEKRMLAFLFGTGIDAGREVC